MYICIYIPTYVSRFICLSRLLLKAGTQTKIKVATGERDRGIGQLEPMMEERLTFPDILLYTVYIS